MTSAVGRERNYMENKIEKASSNQSAVPDTTATENDAPAMVKDIGGMTYIVRVHFSTISKETLEDKIKRLLKDEVTESFY